MPSKGSQHWLQTLVNDQTVVLDAALTAELPALAGRPLTWASPLRENSYAEYRDAAFLRRLGLDEHARVLRAFWPSGGPHWDGLAQSADGAVVLVEAKANVREMVTFCRATSPRSRAQIMVGLEAAQAWLHAEPRIDWLNGYYQMANRLAHLYFLRELAGVETYLVFLYFIADSTHIATSRAEWDAALTAAWSVLGVETRQLHGRVGEVFFDVSLVG